MSGGYQVGAEFCGCTTYGINGSNIFTGTAISSSVNTMGSWTAVGSTTTRDASLLVVCFIVNMNTANANGCINIGIGAGGSQIAIASNLMVGGGNSATYWPVYFYLPLSIPAGSQLWMQSQGSNTGFGGQIQFQLYDSSFTSSESFASVDSIGFVSSTTRGTTIDPGGSTSAKGSFAPLTSSTTADYGAIAFVVDSLVGTTEAGYRNNIDIAIGGSGSETVIIADVLNGPFGSGYAGAAPWYGPIAMTIPAGTRLSARAVSERTATPARTFGLTAYGFVR